MNILKRLRYHALLDRGLEALSPAEKQELVGLTFDHIDHLARTNPARITELMEELAGLSDEGEADIRSGVKLMLPAMDAARTADPTQYARDMAWFKSHIETATGLDAEKRAIQ